MRKEIFIVVKVSLRIAQTACFIIFWSNEAKARGAAWLCVLYGSRYYWGMVETGLYFVRGRTVDSEGRGWAGSFLKTNS